MVSKGSFFKSKVVQFFITLAGILTFFVTVLPFLTGKANLLDLIGSSKNSKETTHDSSQEQISALSKKLKRSEKSFPTENITIKKDLEFTINTHNRHKTIIANNKLSSNEKPQILLQDIKILNDTDNDGLLEYDYYNIYGFYNGFYQ